MGFAAAIPILAASAMRQDSTQRNHRHLQCRTREVERHGIVSAGRRRRYRIQAAVSWPTGAAARVDVTHRRLADHVAASPHRADQVAGPGRRQLLAQLADEHVDDLHLRLVHAAIEMIEERLLGQHHPLAQHQQFEDRVFLAGQMHRLVVHRHLVAVQVEQQRADAQCRLAVPLAAPHDSLHPRQQFRLVERLGDEVVGTKAETLHLDLWPGQPRQDQHRRVVARDTHPPHHLEALDVGQHQVEHHDVVVIVAGQFEPFLAGIRMVDHSAAGL